MASILYNQLNVEQAAVAAAFSLTDVKALTYDAADVPLKYMKARCEKLRAATASPGNEDGNEQIDTTPTTYLVFADVYDELISSLSDADKELVTIKKLTGSHVEREKSTFPIADMARANVPKDVMTFINKHSAELLTIYIGMREVYGNLMPFAAFYKLFSDPDFDIRGAAPFISAALIRQRMAEEIAADIPAFTYKGTLFLRYSPFIDLRVESEKSKKDEDGKSIAADSIVVFADMTGYSKGKEVPIKLVLHGEVPGCLSFVDFKETDGGLHVGEVEMGKWSVLMKDADVKK